MVPFGKGNKQVEGYVVEFIEEEDIDFSFSIKEISVICEKEPLLSISDIELIKIMREKYLCTYIECIRLFLPSGISKGMKFKKKEILYKIKELEGRYNKEPYISIMKYVEKESLERSQIKSKYNLSISSVNTLIKNGFLRLRPEIDWRTGNRSYKYYDKKILNNMQVNTLNSIMFSEENKFLIHGVTGSRSEERRVGKECRSRWSPY